jgi:hypothetical protein
MADPAPVGGYSLIYQVYPNTGCNETAGDGRVLRVFGPARTGVRCDFLGRPAWSTGLRPHGAKIGPFSIF